MKISVSAPRSEGAYQRYQMTQVQIALPLLHILVWKEKIRDWQAGHRLDG